MLLVQLTFIFPLLAVLASAQNDTTYPDCCAALRTKALSVCDFDITGYQIATTSETACICRIDDIETPMNECITCIRPDPELTAYADSYAAVCSNYQTTSTALADNSTSTAMTNSTTSSTIRATTSHISTTTTRSTTAATTTTQVPIASALDNGNDAMGGNVPSIVFAALAVLVQIGF